ncbi:MAG TPA: sodium ion-translocating decarboxylase subunit beta, partial [Candidatus Cloacimonadota bacterium]|nr:sodium ion-translocating decarboxylase subunit beta [Candidatus Cloacimonadota bacterium]
MQELMQFVQTTGFLNIDVGGLAMILAGIVFIYLGIAKEFEPLLLVPIGFGIVVGNIPGVAAQGLGVESEGSVLSYLYFGVKKGVYPSLIFLGVGAMTDFSSLIANPRLILLGAAAQFGIFATFMGSLLLGFNVLESASIGIIGGADGPTSIFLASKMAPHLLGSIALAAYSYMALVPVIQPPIMRLLTTKKERVIRMKALRVVSKREKIIFPIVAFIVTSFIAPGSAVLLAMLFLGNLLKECGVTERLAGTARTSLIDIVTVLIGLTVGAKTTADVFLTPSTIKIFL